jgi:hypothetical protein
MSHEIIKLEEEDPKAKELAHGKLICKCGFDEFAVYRSLVDVVLECLVCQKVYAISTE